MDESRRPAFIRVLAAAGAGLGWITLGYLFCVSIDRTIAAGRPIPIGIVDYFSFFTILSNVFAAAVLTASLRPAAGAPIRRASAVSAAAVYVIAAGLFYVLVLKDVWRAQGPLQRLADAELHYASPALLFFYWLVAVPRGSLRWRHPVQWLAFPLAYYAFIFLRGAYSGVYPYALIDAGARGYPRAFINTAVFVFAVLAIGLMLVAFDRRWAPATRAARAEKLADTP